MTTFENFVPTGVTDDRFLPLRYATIDVRETRLFRKDKVTTRQIMSNSPNWRFVDDGRWTPGFQVEFLAAQYNAKKAAA